MTAWPGRPGLPSVTTERALSQVLLLLSMVMMIVALVVMVVGVVVVEVTVT